MPVSFDSLLQDVRYATRRLMKAPMFTCVAVIVLALGVGVNTAFFSLANGVLLKGLPVPHANRLVNIARTDDGEIELNGGLDERRLQRLIERKPTLVRGLFAVTNFSGAVQLGAAAQLRMCEGVTGNYFETLGLTPVAGRLLVSSDDAGGANGPAVISSRLWQREFGGSPSVIGQVVKVSGLSLVIVGVAPDAFAGLTAPNLLATDLWAPLNSLRPILVHPMQSQARGGIVFRVYARLREGSTISSANAEMGVLGQGIDPDRAESGLAVVAADRALMPTPLARILQGLGLALVGVSSLVLIVACANVSGLVLARATRRTSEIAIRMAIGAGRQRILQMQLIETAMLSMLAGGAGLAIAWALTRGASRVPIPEIGGFVIQPNASPDGRVFAFALMAACVATMMVGWLPAKRMADTDPMRVWSTSAGGGAVTARVKTSTTRLVAFQYAASVSLLLVASLFVRSAATAGRYEARIDLNAIAAGSVALARQNVSDADGRVIFDRLLETDRPGGGRRVALASGVPIGGHGRQEALRIYGRATAYVAHTLVVSPSFADMFDLRATRGRVFTNEDRVGQPNVALVNTLVASDLWPGRDPIGQTLTVSSMPDHPVVKVVGVVEETDLTTRVNNDRRYVFLPLAQHYQPNMVVLVTEPGQPHAAVATLKRTVEDAASEVALMDAKSLVAFVGVGATGAAFAAATIGAVGALGFLVAMVGLYGTVAFVVAERTREFGIMRALGADASHIRRLVIRDASRMLLWGMVPGVVITFLFAGLLQSWLLGLSAHDPLTFIVVPVIMFLVGSLAALLPAHSASKASPTEVMRQL